MNCIFVSVGSLDKCDDIELEHYVPEDDDSIEAYDVRFTKEGMWIAEIDLPIWAAKKVYFMLEKQLRKDGHI